MPIVMQQLNILLCATALYLLKNVYQHRCGMYHWLTLIMIYINYVGLVFLIGAGESRQLHHHIAVMTNTM